MFAQDFLFDKQKLSDFGFVIGSETNGDAVVSGGDIEILSERTPDADNFTYYTGKLDSPIQFNFEIYKLNCDDLNDIYVTSREQSMIAKWLIRKSKNLGYGWLQFDQETYQDIYYKVCFTSMLPIQVMGRTVGFQLSCTSNCGYAFSEEKKHLFTISSTMTKNIIVTSDIQTYIYPLIKLTGDLAIVNINNLDDTQQTQTTISSSSSTVVIDSENDIITGISNPQSDFNWYFPRLIDGENHLRITGSSTRTVTVELTYREPRRILV